MMKKFDRKLVLSDGSEYYGYGFGSRIEKITEIVFNTSPVGYQEILSDLYRPMLYCIGTIVF